MMRVTKVASAEDYQLISSFDEVKRTLLDESKFQDRLEKPLAYWALPNDRRLPLAFLGRSLGDLLSTPFEELSATPGIGQKKISSLVRLLHRATKEEPHSTPYGAQEQAPPTQGDEILGMPCTPDGQFDHTLVSELLWAKWRESVRVHNLQHEKLGRLASSLAEVPTVIWNTPLSFYLDYTVAEIRRLKTHGEKRVRVVLEVFFRIHQMLENVKPQQQFALKLQPNFVPAVERFVLDRLADENQPSEDDVRAYIADALLKQIKLDAGDTVFDLAVGRLGLGGKPQSVRMQARMLGVTRARIYQLLEDCSKVMSVRWPEGQALLATLVQKGINAGHSPIEQRLLIAVRELFFPTKLESFEEDPQI
ncbi:hypothetical protein LOC68_14535 [Blastopirellula sp. JC732]|uniref:Uncharacterized protein n=1 Tax=Blastopirellula sediminis TaxID=2894196 RepID=A0A9X1SH20_9BACT|nr:hypothetical protein [Blastopirellula sediminis]MCC9607100.1 hypothetical protein [Blastopirellula sediminis]MCC9629607.1 hypothetical protein [Blastopirellula sediminis]